MQDTGLLVCSALSFALVPRSWLNRQSRCCAHSLLFTAKIQLRYLFSHQGARHSSFNQMLLPLNEDPKTPCTFILIILIISQQGCRALVLHMRYTTGGPPTPKAVVAFFLTYVYKGSCIFLSRECSSSKHGRGSPEGSRSSLQSSLHDTGMVLPTPRHPQATPPFQSPLASCPLLQWFQNGIYGVSGNPLVSL